MAQRKQNLFGFFEGGKDRYERKGKSRRSDATVAEARRAAYVAGHSKGDTGLFNAWLEESGLWDRSASFKKRLRAEFDGGVEDSDSEYALNLDKYGHAPANKKRVVGGRAKKRSKKLVDVSLESNPNWGQVLISVDSLRPVHSVRTPTWRDNLADQLKTLGWTGRPLLALKEKNGYQLLTGSHRYGAMSQLKRVGEWPVNLPKWYVPVVVIKESDFNRGGWKLIHEAVSDEDRMSVLAQTCNNENAIQIMAEELSRDWDLVGDRPHAARVNALADANHEALDPTDYKHMRRSNPDSGIKFILGITPGRGRGDKSRKSEIQSVLFSTSVWSPREAVEWLRSHGMKSTGGDNAGGYYRFRQEMPEKYKEFRTIEAGKGASNNPKKRGKSKQNPDTASAMFSTFHGADPEAITELLEKEKYESNLAKLGGLLNEEGDEEGPGLCVALISGKDAWITFDSRSPDLYCNPAGTQLYIVGGNQELDLVALKMDDEKSVKPFMVIGVLTMVTYRTKKGFDQFELTDYYHHLGEESGHQPFLVYDTLNKKLSVVGGKYQVKDVGICD
jgi:hypothetical protein